MRSIPSHWPRHTFVRWCLDNNISTENIAMVIGDNVATVAKHYQTWIEGRQETLTNMMKAALAPKAQAATAGITLSQKTEARPR